MPGISGRIGAIVVAAVVTIPVAAQTPAPSAPPRRPRPPVSAQLVVRDQSGTPLDGVRVSISGGGSGRATTDAKGVATVPLSPGVYRLRFEREGFITLERDVTIVSLLRNEIAVALDAAPAPAPPPPPPTPPPPPAPPPTAAASAAGGPATATNVSIAAFLDKNFIGRDPLKESILGCTAGATTRVLQLREPVAVHSHTDLDEILYVVAGDGVVRVRDQMLTVGPGSLIVIPRGLMHSIERLGKNPLIILSTLAGAPCRALSSAQSNGDKQ